MAKSGELLCPCGSKRPYAACCGRYIEQGVPAESAEQLMRSRFTAFALSREAYVLRTWHPSTRPQSLDLETAGRAKWLGLKILRTQAGGPTDTEGLVEFVARYREGGGPASRLHETSRFVREQRQWLYVDGNVDPEGG